MKKNEKIAKELYSKIDLKLREKKLHRYQLAEKIGVPKQTISDFLLNLKDGKLPKSLEKFFKIVSVLDIDYK